MPLHVDLNADVGESIGSVEDDGLLMSISSASIAAGFHAGNPSILRATVRLARRHNVAVGAHPGFPDLEGFGRREMHLPAAELEDLVLYQIAAVAGMAASEGVSLRHVKPHGALYNMAARDTHIASAIARACAAFDRTLILFGPPDSELLKAGMAQGIPVAAEGFADRAYAADGALVPRQIPGAVIHDRDLVVSRVVRMVNEGTVVSLDGVTLPLRVDTVCVHGDTPGAGQLARAVRRGLEDAGVRVAPVGG